MSNQALDVVSEVAARVLRIPTLETRRSDSLDFYDCAVWSIREALIEAFQAGRQSLG
jgi:hypothetical protein